MPLSREELERFIDEKNLPCEIAEESDKYFILYCSRRKTEFSRLAIIEGLGYPATTIGRGTIYVYRFKPKARIEVDIDVAETKARLSPNEQIPVIDLYVPQLCLKGSTYQVRDVLKSYGFKFDILGKVWCRTFSKVSELEDFIRNSLPQLVEEVSNKGVEMSLDSEEIQRKIDNVRWRLQSINRGHIGAAIVEYLMESAPPEAVAEVAKGIGAEEVAKEVERVASELEELGNSIAVYARVYRGLVESYVAVCAKPREYLGKDLFKRFVAKARELGMKRLPHYEYCKYIVRGAEGEAERISRAYEYVARSVATLESYGSREFITQFINRFIDVIEGVEEIESRVKSLEDVERMFMSLVESVRSIVSDKINAIKDRFFSVLS